MASFQHACRDAARRVGLTPFTANEGEPFDSQRHQLVEESAKAPAGAVVAETIATGYTFQGRLVRPALVRLGNGEAAVAAVTAEAAPEEQSQLPLPAADASPE